MPYLVNMLPSDIEKAVKEKWPLILPSGCIEFHGNHLPIGTDMILIEEIVKRVEQRVNIIICPSFVYGPTGYAVGGPETGTIDVNVSIFKNHIKDVLFSFYRMGFRNIIVIQHHQGVDGPGGTAFKMARAELFNDLKILYGEGWFTKHYGKISDWILNVDVLPVVLKGDFWNGHGGKGETEPMILFRPESVKMSKIKKNDFPWNWNRGNEVDLVDIKCAEKNIESIVDCWINYLKKFER